LTGELGKTMKTSVWIGGLQGEIWIKDSANTKQECQPIDRNFHGHHPAFVLEIPDVNLLLLKWRTEARYNGLAKYVDGKTRYVYRILVGKHFRNRPLGRS
jgi:hypothetical protein